MNRPLALFLIVMGSLQLFTAHAQFSKPRREYVEYLIQTDHANREYKLGESAQVTVTAQKGGVPVDNVWVYYTVGDEMMSATHHADSVLMSQGRAIIPMGTRTEPGFRVCSLHFRIYDKDIKDLLKVGYEPERIASFTQTPADFAAFWQQTLQQAEQVDLQPQLTYLPQRSTPQADVFLLRLHVGPHYGGRGGQAPRTVYGYLTKPKDGKKHPVLFCPPGAGSTKIEPTTYYAERGFIYLNINIHDSLNSELPDTTFARLRAATENYNRQGIGQKETFYYREVYAACSRCIDYLCTLPEWDGRHVAVTGGSQGGALTLITAALNPRVTCCSPFYPALSDLLGFCHQRAGGWPKYYQQGAEPEGAQQTLPYYDVVCFARMVQCPTFLSFGYADDTCSPTSCWSVFNAITAPKELRITPTSGHWRFTETNDESVAWMQQQCGMISAEP